MGEVFAATASIHGRRQTMALPTHLKLKADHRTRLGTQLLRLANRYDRALAERLSEWRLAPSHYELLKLLYAAPDYSRTHTQLAQAMGVTLPSITLAIRKLGAMRLVGSQRGEDRRSRIATLTVKGAETLALLYDRYEQFAELLFTSVGDPGSAAVEKAVQRLLARLGELEDQRSARAA
jgi:DNA-binding MarR family transcriptional regulator